MNGTPAARKVSWLCVQYGQQCCWHHSAKCSRGCAVAQQTVAPCPRRGTLQVYWKC
jgi:hypothetical protein